MKFHDAHRIDILRIVSDHGWSKDDVHFVKKRGRILTVLRDNKAFFSYFLKKDVELDPVTADFHSISLFEVKTSSGHKSFEKDWESVLEKLHQWIESFDK